mmetsp:Transcript_30706/g.27903  ORF Transcript_30706/g.27903 Transcript_30706/m.27903 type:complete len:130 (+) Transcript_30706:1949-2338(+)
MANLSAFIMAVMDAQGVQNNELREELGDLIIVCFLLFTIAAVLFFLIDFGKGLYRACKEMKRRGRKKGVLMCIQLLAIPFESGGMTFGDLNSNRLDKLMKTMDEDKKSTGKVAPNQPKENVKSFNKMES